MTLKDFILKAIVSTLVTNKFNQSKAAKILDISRGCLRAYVGTKENSKKLAQQFGFME